MFLFPLVWLLQLLLKLQWLGCRQLCSMTTHVTSVELDKNRNPKYHPIQTESAFFCFLRRWKYVTREGERRRERELQHQPKVDLH